MGKKWREKKKYFPVIEINFANTSHVVLEQNVPTKNFSILKMGKIEKKLNFFFQLLYNFQKKNTNKS